MESFNKLKPREIQSTIMIAFSVISISLMLVLKSCNVFQVLGYPGRDRASTQKLMEQTGENLEDYLVSMRQISDAAYYNVIKRMTFQIRKDIQIRMNLCMRQTETI